MSKYFFMSWPQFSSPPLLPSKKPVMKTLPPVQCWAASLLKMMRPKNLTLQKTIFQSLPFCIWTQFWEQLAMIASQATFKSTTISHTFESTTNSCYCRSKSPQIINLVLYRTLESVRKQVLTSVLSKSSTFLTRQRQKLSLNGFLLTRHVTDFSVIIFNSFLLYLIDQSFFQPAFEFYNSL